MYYKDQNVLSLRMELNVNGPGRMSIDIGKQKRYGVC